MLSAVCYVEGREALSRYKYVISKAILKLMVIIVFKVYPNLLGHSCITYLEVSTFVYSNLSKEIFPCIKLWKLLFYCTVL